MYRYVYGDDRETLVGIQETLRENFSDGIIIPEQLPHYTILGLGEIVNKIKRCNNPDLNLHPSSVRQIYDNISSVIDPGETSVLTYDGVGQTSGSIYLSLLGVDCPAINERAKALKQLSTFTTLGCKFIPHITIGYIRDGNYEIMGQALNETDQMVKKYFGSGDFNIHLGAPTMKRKYRRKYHL